MDALFPWLGYVIAYMIGGIIGLLGAAMFYGAARGDEAEEIAELRARNADLEERLAALSSPGGLVSRPDPAFESHMAARSGETIRHVAQRRVA